MVTFEISEFKATSSFFDNEHLVIARLRAMAHQCALVLL
jgi:hypothetical protein